MAIAGATGDPNYTSYASGCALDAGVRLKASADQISPSVVRFRIETTDDSSWDLDAALTLYVGEGPTCGVPPNDDKATVQVVTKQTVQVIDLEVVPYSGAWAYGEIKQFWVGKSELAVESARATGMVSIKRECI